MNEDNEVKIPFIVDGDYGILSVELPASTADKLDDRTVAEMMKKHVDFDMLVFELQKVSNDDE